MARVLIVDDDTNSRQLLAYQISSAGHTVEERSDGEAGLAAVKATPPDLVVLDVMMPAMDGWGVCRRIRALPQIGKLPIIILTARTHQDAAVKSVEAGANVYMEKPWDRKKLIDQVNRLIALT
jgi:DNA-binding response OmpR family regulator